MSTKMLLRIAAMLMLLHCIGHTFGTLGWKKTSDPIKQNVIRQMTDHKFQFMCTVHSMADGYDGYGLVTILSLFLMSAMLWTYSDNSSGERIQMKMLVLLSIILLLWGIIELIFFFPFAASFTLLSMLLTVISVLKSNNHST